MAAKASTGWAFGRASSEGSAIATAVAGTVPFDAGGWGSTLSPAIRESLLRTSVRLPSMGEGGATGAGWVPGRLRDSAAMMRSESFI
jgi:hypothetical protein